MWSPYLLCVHYPAGGSQKVPEGLDRILGFFYEFRVESGFRNIKGRKFDWFLIYEAANKGLKGRGRGLPHDQSCIL